MVRLVLVVGADEALVRDALDGAGSDDGLVVLDPSAGALEALEQAVPDPRIWYQIGDAQVVPLPDAFVDAAIGDASADVRRVLK